MKSIKFLLVLSLALLSYVAVSAEQNLSDEQKQYAVWAKDLWQSLDRQNGEISLSNGIARLTVPDEFYYLNPVDAKKILVEVWENPPQSSEGVLGMLLPTGSTPFDKQSWAVTIEYQEDGYVSDKDADKIDYDELLGEMQRSTQAASDERVRQGYESIALVGWASEPFYDAQTHKLHWAKEVKFGSQAVNTLNYNIRILGRQGVLVLNFIAGMDQKPLIDASVDKVLALAEFNQGSKYDEFDPSVDDIAAYGIGALVAGKVIAKTGLLAAAFIFLKKFGIILVIGLIAILSKMLNRKKSEKLE